KLTSVHLSSYPFPYTTLFRSIYEGLLESSLALARVDLTLDAKGNYVPARKGQLVRVREGSVYLQNASGARKATGSYFTKQFAVRSEEHTSELQSRENLVCRLL